MSALVVCDSCGNEFFVSELCCGVIEEGDISVQYFFCPRCGQRYQILTTDPQMRELIEKRKAIQRKIATARTGEFREKTIQGYMRELDRIEAEQERILPTLKKRGEEVLHRKSGWNDEPGGEAT